MGQDSFLQRHRLQFMWLCACPTADSVADKSLSVSAKLETRRETMEQLYKVQQLLKKLQVKSALDHACMHATCTCMWACTACMHGARRTCRTCAGA